MTPEEKAKADKLAADKKAEEKAKADKLAADKKAEEDLEAEIKAEEEAADKKALSGTFIMTVGHLACGHNGRTHFFNDKKPEISLKAMGGDKKTLLAWINAGWVKKGSYKK